METVSDNNELNKILDLFQTYQKNGQCSRLVLETMGGAVTAHLSVQWPNTSSPGWTSRTETTETKPTRPRRITPSRRRRNQARREQWLARKTSKSQDNLTDRDTEKKEENPISTENLSIEVKNVAENPRQLICEVQSIETVREDNVIEQIDGNTESTVTYDLMISAASDHEAFCSIEENLCRGDDGDKVPFISEVPSKSVKDDDNDENMVFTMEI